MGLTLSATACGGGATSGPDAVSRIWVPKAMGLGPLIAEAAPDAEVIEADLPFGAVEDAVRNGIEADVLLLPAPMARSLGSEGAIDPVEELFGASGDAIGFLPVMVATPGTGGGASARAPVATFARHCGADELDRATPVGTVVAQDDEPSLTVAGFVRALKAVGTRIGSIGLKSLLKRFGFMTAARISGRLIPAAAAGLTAKDVLDVIRESYELDRELFGLRQELGNTAWTAHHGMRREWDKGFDVIAAVENCDTSAGDAKGILEARLRRQTTFNEVLAETTSQMATKGFDDDLQLHSELWQAELENLKEQNEALTAAIAAKEESGEIGTDTLDRATGRITVDPKGGDCPSTAARYSQDVRLHVERGRLRMVNNPRTFPQTTRGRIRPDGDFSIEGRGPGYRERYEGTIEIDGETWRMRGTYVYNGCRHDLRGRGRIR